MILEELLKKVDKSEVDEQMKQICDEIMKEESPKMKYFSIRPDGPNIFLAIECSDTKNINFLCLEREFKEKYFVSLWSIKLKFIIGTDIVLKRKQIWDISEVKCEKILKCFAEKLKFVRGD